MMSRIRINIRILTLLNIVIFGLLFNNSLLNASGGKIVGKVVDADTKTPMPGVNVVILSLQIGAATDTEGDYFVLNIPPGEYVVRASMIGYSSVVTENVEVSLNHTTVVNFELPSTVLDIGEDIIITASRPPVEKDQTSTRHYVDAKEISTRPATQLMEILTTLPGIDTDAGGELVVRRGSLDQVSFLIDGIRARNPLDFNPYTNINLSSIQELEIITGGFNAEYGEARSGVFNIVTKEGSDKFNFYSELRWTPPGKYHWGTAFYDYSSPRYWENANARHLQWWIDNPNMWVDQNGVFGNDPGTSWTPQQAYDDYINTHKPLNDYTNEDGYLTEFALGGPTPINDLYYFVTAKYRQIPPVTGNSVRDKGTWFDGTFKLTYRINENYKLLFSSFYGTANTNIGLEYMNSQWVSAHGLENKYAFYDYSGYPESRIDGQTIELTHVINKNTFYQVRLNRVYRYQRNWTFPGDDDGWETGVPLNDRLRAKDKFGNPIPGGFANLYGLHTTGYYYRGVDKNTDLTLSGDVVSQINKFWHFKGGWDFTYYTLDRFQEAKGFNATENSVYHPYEGNLYAQSKLEFEGMIINLGLRFDFYNPNDKKYTDIYDPFDIYDALKEGREPTAETTPTTTFGQLSPRLGISHPISENTVLHFSYGHFFQRAAYGNYGEGTGGDADDQQVTGILNTYIANADLLFPTPYNLGNRDLKPRKTVAYELGVEHNIGGIVTDVTVYYKDITNTVRPITVITKSGGRYITTGNGDYGDAKGIEISLRKPLTDYWGGYLNYSWSTGIEGRSGDPDIISAPESGVIIGEPQNIGDYIVYDAPRLKFGLTLFIPQDSEILGGILSNLQVGFDYQVYYAHNRISSHVFSEAGTQFERSADKNADLRIRKDFDFGFIKPAFFIEVHNLFNNTWANIDAVKSASPEDRIDFINSGFTKFPDQKNNGAPFPDVIQYRNLPRQIIFGMAVTL